MYSDPKLHGKRWTNQGEAQAREDQLRKGTTVGMGGKTGQNMPALEVIFKK